MLNISELGERLSTRLWFIPALFAVGAFVAATGMVALDRHLQTGGPAFYLYGGTPEGARNVLSTIAQSMLTFTGLVFTITMLVLQLASSQLSPRVLRTFLADRQNQVVLGLFVATFVYTLAIIRDVRAGADGAEEFVPALSVWFSFVLLLASVGAFIFYINHMAHAIRPSTVIDNIASDASRALDRIYPPDAEPSEDSPVASATDLKAQDWMSVPATEAGYIQGVDHGALAGIARKADVFVELVPRVGDFVARSSDVFRVRPANRAGELHDRLRGTLRTGRERTMHSDAAFGVRQLVDVAVRALSPGTNDPTTAAQVVDRLQDLLLHTARRPTPVSLHRDDQGRPRAFVRVHDWVELLDLAFDELRLYGGAHVQVAGRMAAALRALSEAAPPPRRQAVERQAERLRLRIASADPAVRPDLERAVAVARKGPSAGPISRSG